MGMGISYAAELNFLLMVPFVLYEMAKFERKDVAMVMSIQSAFDIFGRLALPILSHKSGWHPRLMYAITLIGSSIARTILAIFCDTGYVVLACSALWGLSKGGKAVFQSLVLPKYVPYEKLATAFGVQMMINGFLSLIIGPFIGNNQLTIILIDSPGDAG
ncbi:uncharacterized protein LOC112904734 [Agrilus planipennis]|uniref:Uncharacterized protein LOC112904734 n=1 Tax=Agrilus planipennis TaxID=224129 RepID=A0A7F5R0Z3_AGRPL|nr:uncharacterized protein LOC112904734 [Agrilus planipennis]